MKNLLMGSLLTLTLVSCNSGGNGGGAPGYNHNDLAKKFVSQLNLDSEFNVELVKKSTLQSDFIVIFDPYTNTYDAIDIESYDPAIDNAADYYFDSTNNNYFGLDVLPGHYETDYSYEIVGYDYDGYAIYDYVAYDTWIPTRYQDYYTGITFEKTAATAKDLAKVAAIKEVATLEKSAKFLSSEFGLSLNRSKEVARLASHWKKASKKGLSASEQDLFSTELLGFSITNGIEAAKESAEGDSTKLSNLIDSAAAANNITPEHASQLMTKVFGL